MVKILTFDQTPKVRLKLTSLSLSFLLNKKLLVSTKERYL